MSLKLKVEILDLNNFNFEKNTFRIRIKVYVFKILKLFEITFSEKGIKVFKKESKYKYEFVEFMKIFFKEENNEILKLFTIRNYKLLNIKLRSFDMKLKVGVLENMITSFCVTIISTVVSTFLGMQKKLYNKNKLYFKVLPEYDKFLFDLNLNLTFELSSKGIYKFVLNNLKGLRVLKLFIKEVSKRDVLEDNTIPKKLKESSI